MKIVTINGNTKQGGFIAGALSIISTYLEKNGAEIERIFLHEADIKDCIGCFSCLKTGRCVTDDDMTHITESMISADGFVIGSPVRNGLITSCYKRFIERITYTLGFTLLLEDKYTLAISSVGYMGGRKINKQLLGLQNVFHTRLSSFLFYSVGIPSKLEPSDIRLQLERAAGKLIADINTHTPRRLFDRIAFAIDRTAMRKMMFEKNPDVYANVIKCWREKGYIS